jgi:hypothetical protein
MSMAEYRITATIDGHSSDPTDGERVLERLIARASELGPVVDQDGERDELNITVATDAGSAHEALTALAPLLSQALVQALGPVEVVAFNAELASREPVPA